MSIYSFKFVASACAKLKCILAITALAKPLLKIVPILKHKSNVAQLLHLSIPYYLKKINKSVYPNVCTWQDTTHGRYAVVDKATRTAYAFRTLVERWLMVNGRWLMAQNARNLVTCSVIALNGPETAC
jgi:hypothetical protein